LSKTHTTLDRRDQADFGLKLRLVVAARTLNRTIL
jgi:hypothetical protein